ncbi:MAG: hypothetical protein H6624_12460 [Bdellovibrionaceae bacterium]|nr:hypothetical protein [Pseudobdellovibrionaceae bacterium]
MKNLVLLCLLLTTAACSSISSKNDYTADEAYQMRQELNADFFKSGEENLSQDQINNLLSKKVSFDRPLKVAVVKLNHLVSQSYSFRNPHTGSMTPVATKKNSQIFKLMLEKSSRIKDISVVPQFMMPRSPELRSLRDVAAIMQADLLMIIYTKTDSDYDFSLIGKNEAKAVATLESIVVDVKTGVIPFTSIATGVAHLKKESEDFSNEEFRVRTVLAAEDHALNQLSEDMAAYFK